MVFICFSSGFTGFSLLFWPLFLKQRNGPFASNIMEAMSCILRDSKCDKTKNGRFLKMKLHLSRVESLELVTECQKNLKFGELFNQSLHLLGKTRNKEGSRGQSP